MNGRDLLRLALIAAGGVLGMAAWRLVQLVGALAPNDRAAILLLVGCVLVVVLLPIVAHASVWGWRRPVATAPKLPEGCVDLGRLDSPEEVAAAIRALYIVKMAKGGEGQ